MSGFMVGRNFLFLVGNDFTFLLCADSDFDKRLVNISLCNICLIFLAASIAASFMRFSRSAPVNPAVVCAIVLRSTSSPIGFPLTCTLRISSLPLTSGLPTTTLRSKRPGLKIAGSRISTLLVAAITIMPAFTPNPSISTSIWLSVCSLSSCPPPIPVPLRLATASISSINTIQGEFFFASSNKSLTLDAPTPTNISTKSEPEMLKTVRRLRLQLPSQEVSYLFPEGLQELLP